MQPAAGAPQRAAGSTLAAAALAQQLQHLRAPATASMVFGGPLVKETQPMRRVPVAHEYERHNYLTGGVYGRTTTERRQGLSGDTFDGGVAGDGSKFSLGFFRGRTDWTGVRREQDEAGCARSHARDAQRALFITANQQRTGYDPITGKEVAGALDCYKPRGRVSMQDSAGPLRAVEGVQRDTDPGVRMFRIEKADGARAVARAAALHSEGLTATTRHSSELGFGRRALPSVGVAEALAGAAYGGTTPAAPADYAATAAAGMARDPPTHLVKSGVFGRGVWDVQGGAAAGNEELQWRLAALAGQRARNRVFDTDSPAVIACAASDPFARNLRETRELLAARPPRPVQHPASFTATAKALHSMRATAARNAEVAQVQSLRF